VELCGIATVRPRGDGAKVYGFIAVIVENDSAMPVEAFLSLPDPLIVCRRRLAAERGTQRKRQDENGNKARGQTWRR